MKVTNIKFTEWKQCNPLDGSKNYIKLNLQAYSGGQTHGLGQGTPLAANASEGTVQYPNSSMDLGLQAPPGKDPRSYAEAVVVHEFGHVLGYEHEQDQEAGFDDTYYQAPILVDGSAWSPCSPGGGYWDAAGDAYVWLPANFNNVLITTYDRDSIMNYCHATGREYSGRLSTLDIQGVQTVTEYGAPARSDMDGDGIADRVDNCPYVANGLQEDTNGDAELAVQLANPSGWNTCLSGDGGAIAEDGHIPTGADPQCYVDHWHLAYQGDACDPNAITLTTFENVKSQVETHVCTAQSPCYDQYQGASSYTVTVTDGGTYPVNLSTGLVFDSHIGGPAAMALPNAVGHGAPTFCACLLNTAAACSRDPNYNCVIADDNADPYKGGNIDPSKYKQLSLETTQFGCNGVWCALTPWPWQTFNHVDPAPGYDPNTLHKTWDFIHDLGLFGMAADANDLHGVGWVHNSGFHYTIQMRQQWYPTDAGTMGGLIAASTKNLSNNYWVNTAHWDAIVKHYALPLPPLGIPWYRIPYCDPLWDPTWGERVQHEGIHYMSAANLGGVFAANGLHGSTTFDLTPRFTSRARELLLSLTSGNDMLVADDRVGGQPRSATGYNAIVLNAGTTRIVGAISDDGTGMDSTSASSVVGSGSVTLRSFSATNQALYWLTNSTGWQVNTRLIARALVGNATVATTALSGVPLQSPQGIAYNAATNTLFVVDWVSLSSGTAIRLINLNPVTGVATELWTTGPGVANNGFETGDLTGWTASGASQTVLAGGAHSGNYSAMLGATTPTNGDSNISQTFTAPSDATGMSFWYKMTCPDTVTYDWATATLKDNAVGGGTTTLLPKICTTNSWTQVTGSVTAGHTYTLTLTSHDDNYAGDPTYTLFDDVALSGPTPTVYVSTTADGEVIVSTSQSSGSVDVLVTNTVGRPTGSYTVAGTLLSAVVGHASGLTLPLTQTATDSTPNVLLSFVNRSALSYGVCNSTLFKAIANLSTGTGALTTGPACP